MAAVRRKSRKSAGGGTIREMLSRVDERTELLMQDREIAARERQQHRDLLGSVTDRLGKVEIAAARVPVIEETLWRLETGRIERLGAAKLIGRVATRARILWTLAGGGFLAAATWVLSSFGGWPRS